MEAYKLKLHKADVTDFIPSGLHCKAVTAPLCALICLSRLPEPPNKLKLPVGSTAHEHQARPTVYHAVTTHHLCRRLRGLQHCHLVIQQGTTVDLCNKSRGYRPASAQHHFVHKFVHFELIRESHALDRFDVPLLSSAAQSDHHYHSQVDCRPSLLHWPAHGDLGRCCARSQASFRGKQLRRLRRTVSTVTPLLLVGFRFLTSTPTSNNSHAAHGTHD